jgi:hypothetical protein
VAVSSAADGDFRGNEVHGSRIRLNTWNMRDAPAADRVRVVVHEYFHLWQADAAGAEAASGRLGPAWLVEGSANFVAFRALADAGVVDWNDAREYLVLVANGISSMDRPAVPPLRDLTDDAALVGPGVGCCSYAVATLAVERLTGAAGPAALGRYFEAIGRGDDWRVAFTAGFGRDPDAFSDAFETERADLLTPTGRDETGLLRRPPFNDHSAGVALASAATVVRGRQALLRGTTAAGTHCTLTVAAVDGRSVLTMPTYADAAGAVFWLWTVPTQQPAGVATATATCGGSPAVIAVDVT